jgi:hypothetical protein
LPQGIESIFNSMSPCSRLLAAAAAAAACARSASAQQQHSIEAYGAVAGVDTHAAALANGRAFLAAALAANASAPAGSVLVPAGAVYAFLPAAPTIAGLVGVTVFIEGTLNASTANFSTVWPGYAENNCWHMLSFEGGVGLRFVSETGKGLVNGRGNAWWWA